MALTASLRKKIFAPVKGSQATTFPFDLSSLQHQELDTPYVITDLEKPRQNALRFKGVLPQVHLCYAVKANSDQNIIRKLDDRVDGYDIASLGELELLLKEGVAADRIFYSNPVKIPHHIDQAFRKGVRYFAFDSITEVAKLAKHAPGAIVYLRLKVSDYGSKFPLSKKFGVDPMHALDYCSLAKDSGLQVRGLTFHVGSQSENTQAWKTALEIAGKTIEQLRERGIDIEFLNLGGGFPADYGQPAPSLEEVAAAIIEGTEKFIPPHITLLAEPGRYIVADSGALVTSVIGREHRGGSDWLYLDVGTFQGLLEPLEMKDWRYPVYTTKNPRGYKKDFVLSGPTCDAFDTIGGDYQLPSDINVGDKLYLGAVGAYSLVYASNFNGFKPPKVYYINEASSKGDA